MGEHRLERTAVDTQGRIVAIIEWRGDRGTPHMHDDVDLRDPQLYSRFTLSDGTTKLVQADEGTLRNPITGDVYTLR